MTEKLTKTVLFFLVSIGMSLTATYTYAQEGGLILGDPVQEKPKPNVPSEEDGAFELQEQPTSVSKIPSTEQKTNSLTTSIDQNRPTNGIDLIKPAKPAVQEEKKEVKEEESVLTFNFLYYLIQKFKFEEVIDQ